jgi:hypothetical protein
MAFALVGCVTAQERQQMEGASVASTNLKRAFVSDTPDGV